MKRDFVPDDARMPARLLDVGSKDSKTWRVVETQGRVPYVALSHRWSRHTPRLLRSNYPSYHLPQADNILPQNYQDVISTCRAIPIRYLWIDSLCILQDDIDGLDFRHEAPVMSDIYEHAVLTMMIGWEFTDASLFRKRHPRSIPRPALPRHFPDLSNYWPVPISGPGEYAFVDCTHDFEIHVAGAPINSRGWVLQERCLSRRILYLSNDQLFWECDGNFNGFVSMEVSPDSAYDRSLRQSIHLLPHDSSAMDWSKILGKYCGSSLTYEQDRLVAIAGLAKATARLTGDTYLAGIWRGYLLKIRWRTH